MEEEHVLPNFKIFTSGRELDPEFLASDIAKSRESRRHNRGSLTTGF